MTTVGLAKSELGYVPKVVNGQTFLAPVLSYSLTAKADPYLRVAENQDGVAEGKKRQSLCFGKLAFGGSAELKPLFVQTGMDFIYQAEGKSHDALKFSDGTRISAFSYKLVSEPSLDDLMRSLDANKDTRESHYGDFLALYDDGEFPSSVLVDVKASDTTWSITHSEKLRAGS